MGSDSMGSALTMPRTSEVHRSLGKQILLQHRYRFDRCPCFQNVMIFLKHKYWHPCYAVLRKDLQRCLSNTSAAASSVKTVGTCSKEPWA